MSRRVTRKKRRAISPWRSVRTAEAATAAWYRGKKFAVDWTSWHFPNWSKLLRHYRGRPTRVLEIGSWEGRSALFFLNYLPLSRIACIDTFEGGQEHRQSVGFESVLRAVEKRFDANTSEFRGRVRKIKARSADTLTALGAAQRRFDIAYIDGSHLAADVHSDAMLTWPLMVRGGLVIFDDDLWDNHQGPRKFRNPGSMRSSLRSRGNTGSS